MPVPPTAVAQLASAVAMLVLAGILVWLNFRSRASRAFALLLVLRGGAIVNGAFFGGPGGEDPAAPELSQRLFPYFALAIPFAALYFASVYPHERAWLGGKRRAGPALLLGALAVEVLYVADHRLFWGADGAASQGFMGAPLGPVFDMLWVSFAFVALLLGREGARLPDGPRRSSLLFVSLGFALVVLYDRSEALFQSLGDPASFELVATLVSLALVGLVALRLGRERGRADARRYVLTLPLPVLSAGMVAWVGSDLLSGIFAGLWRVALPALVTYALLKHQIFDIDVKIKWTLKQSTVAGIFLAVFFSVSEGAQVVFSNRMGTFVGIGAAALLLFALSPLQHLAQRVADKAMPHVKPLGELTHPERAAIYRAQLELAWADGTLSRDERELLSGLRDRLGLSREEASRLEDEVGRTTGAP